MDRPIGGPHGGGPLGLAIIGSSGHARRVVVPTLTASTEAELVGVLGSSASRSHQAADELGCRGYADLDDLLADTAIDAVWVTAPNALHAWLASELLAAGVSVLLEKPMATEVADAEAIAAAARGSSAVLRIAYQHRFRRAHQRVREALQRGKVGEVGVIRIHRYWRFPYFAGQSLDDLSPWRRSPTESGGWCLNDIASHLVDLASWLLDEPLGFAGGALAHQVDGVDNDATVALVLGSPSRQVVVIDASNALESPASSLEIHGTGGWLRARDPFGPRCTLTASDGDEEVFTDPPEAPYLRLLDDFVTACHGGASRGCTADEALGNVRLLVDARTRSRVLRR